MRIHSHIFIDDLTFKNVKDMLNTHLHTYTHIHIHTHIYTGLYKDICGDKHFNCQKWCYKMGWESD